jgi:Na+-translocating ferredoxin:NAD+ oxidoreductase subunit B
MSALPKTIALVDRIDALLPQTQCRQCTYAGCRPYAEAIAGGAADINQCPPGGDEGVRLLAALLRVDAKSLNPAHGTPKPRSIAIIDETACIGCILCIRACPVDAIVGAAKQMHTVLVDECTGCELCLTPCPMDCITMQPIENNITSWHGTPRADRARERYNAKLLRLEHRKREKAERLAARQAAAKDAATGLGDRSAEVKRAAIAGAIERARTRRAAGKVS